MMQVTVIDFNSIEELENVLKDVTKMKTDQQAKRNDEKASADVKEWEKELTKPTPTAPGLPVDEKRLTRARNRQLAAEAIADIDTDMSGLPTSTWSLRYSLPVGLRTATNNPLANRLRATVERKQRERGKEHLGRLAVTAFAVRGGIGIATVACGDFVMSVSLPKHLAEYLYAHLDSKGYF